MKTRGWTQETLAEKTGMLQPRISGLMKPGKTRPNIETLRRVAEAFDCALIVRFAPFSELARWAEDFEPDSFNVPSFKDDAGFIERKSATSDKGTAILSGPATGGAISIFATGTNVLALYTAHNRGTAPAGTLYALPKLVASTVEKSLQSVGD